MKILTPGIDGEYWRWPESRSVQQLVCLLAITAIDVACVTRLSLPRLRHQKKVDHEADIQNAVICHKLCWQLATTCDKKHNGLASGTSRSLDKAVEVFKREACPPGDRTLGSVTAGEWRVMMSVADYILYDVMFHCGLWTRKAPQEWQTMADNMKAMWERHNMFPKSEERAEDIRFLIKCRSGYYVD